ncbi:MAG TPA: TolC family protein [Flavobacteriaceae bacterium]|nr:TolC family protein [Flavobacteriaceae bacterium]
MSIIAKISFLKNSRYFWTATAIFFSVLSSFAQNFPNSFSSKSEKQTFASMISILDSTAKSHTKNSFFKPGNPELLETVFQPIWDFSSETNLTAQSDLEINKAKMDLLRKEYGLELKAGYLENIDKGIFGPGDIYYNRRGKLEVEWNLLDNGLFENRRKIKELELANLNEERELAQTQMSAKYGQLYNQVIYYFDQARIRVIENYLSLQNTLLQTSAELYRLDEISWSEVLEEMGQKARLENKLKAYRNYDFQFSNYEIPNLDAFALPLVDVNLAKMQLEENNITHFNLASDSLKLNYNPLLDVNLSLFARYNIFGGAETEPLPVESFSGREYFSVGVDVSIPLFFNTKAKQKILELERKQTLEERKNQSTERSKEIYNHYYEYEFTLQQYIQFYAKYLKTNDQIKEQILLPVGDPEYSPRKLAELLGQRYQAVIELIDLKQKLYLKLLKLGSYMSVPVSDFVEPIDISRFFENTEKPNLSAEHLYIWSSDFGRFSNPELIALLKTFSIKTIHLSFLENQSEKALKFVQNAHNQGIKVFLLVGNNQLIFEKTNAKLKSKFQQARKINMDGVHLDVEPQVFEDWNKRREEYRNMYSVILESAHNLADEYNMKLVVSIPHYFEPILEEINQLTDEAFIMVYETDQIDQIKKRIEKEASILNCKLVVALRPNDFESIGALRQTMKNLKLKPCQNFALHDLDSLLKLADNEK